MKLTQKQETFCVAYIDTGNASEAYRRAYSAANMKPATVNRAAKELFDNPKITARLDALRQPAVEAAQVSLTGHMARLDALSREAESSGQFAAAIMAETNRGKAAGFYRTKVEVDSGNDLVEAIIAARKRCRLSNAGDA